MEQAIARARHEALKSAEQFRLGAAVFRRNSVLASGRNRNANSCGLDSIHAEMDALFKVSASTTDLHLVVVRVLRDGQTTALSKPCSACWKNCRRRVRAVTYTTGDPQCPFATARF
jgi:cytidine deaminase